MSFYATLQMIQRDVRRYHLEHDGQKSVLQIVLANPGLWVLVVYRLRRYAAFYCPVPVLRAGLLLETTLLSHLLKLMTGIELPHTVVLGPGCFIPHIGSIIVGYRAQIGANCTITQCVTIGRAGRGDRDGYPTIGSNVYIGPGAVILGRIHVGDHVAIGANAVVTKDVPDGAVAAGIPAKIISDRGSADFMKVEAYADAVVV